MKYVKVIVDISLQKLDRTFDYKVPEELSGEIHPGVRIRAPFGNREITGYVLDVSDASELPDEKLKFITCIEPKSTEIESELIELAAFMKEEYGCTMNQALKTVLPSKRKVAARKAKVVQTPIEETGETPQLELTLNTQQQAALDGILKNYPKNALIHGVTGSGKTVIYLKLIKEMIARGKQTILLIPEISLTLQNLNRFYEALGDRVGVVNSRQSAGEKYEVFRKASEGEIDVVIGPRSAVFTPFRRLGLIVMDEEHDGAYFSETTPRYKTGEVAEKRAQLAGAAVVYGSATPSVEIYKRALEGELDLYELKERAVKGSGIPTSEIIDLSEEFRQGNKSIFSRRLAAAITDRLNKKEQIMLFLNRRGLKGFISCRSCGFVYKCPHCDVSMTLHFGSRLMCHYCGYEEQYVGVCKSCGSKAIGANKIGTEKVESLVAEAFPQAKILRMDSDTTTGKAGHSRILSQFAKGKADILIGTQMIVKGHDFPGVTLVGVLSADLSLFANDFRASERTFQLIAQAAGRAGRGQTPGEVIIQTYNPESPVIKAAAAQDYKAFYEEEIAYRKILAYPPEGEMLSVLASSPDEEQVRRECEYLTMKIARAYGERVKIIGPTDDAIHKLLDNYRCVFNVKCDDKKVLLDIRNGIMKEPVASAFSMDIL